MKILKELYMPASVLIMIFGFLGLVELAVEEEEKQKEKTGFHKKDRNPAKAKANSKPQKTTKSGKELNRGNPERKSIPEYPSEEANPVIDDTTVKDKPKARKKTPEEEELDRLKLELKLLGITKQEPSEGEQAGEIGEDQNTEESEKQIQENDEGKKDSNQEEVPEEEKIKDEESDKEETDETEELE